MKRVMVTGAAGFIGSNLCRSLLNEGLQVTAVDNLITGQRDNIRPLIDKPNFDFRELDISSQKFLRELSGFEFDEIYHLACPTGVPNISKLGQEMIETCSLGTFNVLNLAVQWDARVLFSSSAEVYGDPQVSTQSEDYCGHVDPIGPRSAYEEGKRFSEALVRLYVLKHDLRASIVRIFNTYGPGMSKTDQRVIPRFLDSLLNSKPIQIYGDGQQTRTFLFIDDLITGLKLVMEKGSNGEAYNLGGEQEQTIDELCRAMQSVVGRTARVEYLPHFITDHARRLPDISRARSLGWKPRIELEEGLRRQLEAFSVMANC